MTPDSRLAPLLDKRESSESPHHSRPRPATCYLVCRYHVWHALSCGRGAKDYWLARMLEYFLMLLIVSNVVLVAALTGIEETDYADWYYYFELGSALVFSTEYVLRVWTAVEEEQYADPCIGRLRWALTPINGLDLIAATQATILLLGGESTISLADRIDDDGAGAGACPAQHGDAGCKERQVSGIFSALADDPAAAVKTYNGALQLDALLNSRCLFCLCLH